MAPRYDFAIFGASPLAALLCGILAHRHGCHVLRIADPVPHQRLPRSIEVALPLATRPASWRLTRAAAKETADLLFSVGGQDRLDRVDVKIVADLPDTATALAHLTHVAAGYGFVSRNGTFRGIARFSGEVDLTNSTVQSIEAARISLTPTTSGAQLTLDGEAVSAGGIVLADDAAILDLLPDKERPVNLLAEAALATLTAPAKRLPATIVRYPDRGVILMQNEDRSVLALVTGQADSDARLASCLGGMLPLQRRATTHYRRLVTADGAPLVGRLEPSGLVVVAGLGSVAAFLAPPLARLLVGEASDEEAAWFAAHEPGAALRAPVAELAEVRR